MSRYQNIASLVRPCGLLFAGLLLGALALQAMECEKPHVVGAGVLPYAVRDGDVVVLLGYDPGRGWTDFGGGPRKITNISSGEIRCESHEETALREGFEELRLVIGCCALQEALRPGRYFPRSADPLAYRTYTIQVPFQEESAFAARWVPLESAFDEKKAFLWVPLTGLVALARGGSDRLPGAPIDAPLWSAFWVPMSEALNADLEESYFPGSAEAPN